VEGICVNHTEYLKSKKIFNGHKSHSIVLTISICLAVLAVVFFLSFYISYNKISSSKDISKNINIALDERNAEIVSLQELIKEKDKQIAEYKELIEKYELKFGDITVSNGTIKKADVNEKSTTNSSITCTAGNSNNKSSNTSKVQKDLYPNLLR
jgi:hypothetical protein